MLLVMGGDRTFSSIGDSKGHFFSAGIDSA